MKLESILLYASGFVTAVGVVLLAAAITHGIVLGAVGLLLLYDAPLVGIIGFMLAGLGGVGVSAALEMRGDVNI